MPQSPRPSARASAAAAPPKFPRDAWVLAVLEREGLGAPAALEALRQEAPEWLASAVTANGLAPADRLAAALARAAHVSVADLAAVEPAALQFVPESAARQYAALPLAASNRSIRIATANPMDLDAEQALGFVAGRQVEFAYALPERLFQRINELYRPERSLERLVKGLRTDATAEAVVEAAPGTGLTAVEGPTAKLVDAMIADAVREHASEVHLEPSEQGLTIRYRTDGISKEVMRVPRDASGPVVRRLKVIARLDISDPRHAQDGRAAARVDGRAWELRISTTPVPRLGEQVAVRLLDPAAPVPALDALGLWPDERALLERLLARRDGLVLAAGPADNGKTTLLYAALAFMRVAGATLATVEDPVAHPIPGINQVQVSEKTGLAFAAAVRAAMQQDPAILLIGELRDEETASLAVQAARTGHLVLSAVRTTDAASAVSRLRSLGVDRQALAGALKGVIGQRLLRSLCASCAEPAEVTSLPEPMRPPDGFERPVAIRKAKGCAQCGFTGYRGRSPIQETLVVEVGVAGLIAADAAAEELVQAGRRLGMRTLWESGIRRVWAGDTSYEELIRVVGEPARLPDVTVRAAADVTPGATGAAPTAPPPARPSVAPASTPARAASEPRAAEPPAAAAVTGQAPAGAVLLVADDDPAMRALVTTILAGQGFRTAEAADGLEALEQARRLNPALLLLDMDMPHLDGFGVLEALRQRLAGRAVPVIVVTAKDDPATETRCIEMGAEDYLTKPIQPSSLVVRIRAVLRRAGVH